VFRTRSNNFRNRETVGNVAIASTQVLRQGAQLPLLTVHKVYLLLKKKTKTKNPTPTPQTNKKPSSS